MPRACSQCGCTDIDTDPARGDVVCTNCGTVLEDQIIVSEVQYQENAAGGASVIGQFVSNDGTRAQSFQGAYGFTSTEDSRKLTLENGYKRLKEMGFKLHMHQSSIDTAFGFFKIAVANKFTRGRKMEYVLASCLYLVCRVDPGGSEDLELMLIDFSDLIQVNVHVLGRTFVQLATELCQNIRIVDPIIYIRRFANQLYFEDKLNKVVESATRLVARMKRDWMHTGRRPAGLCGAALLISSRMHNFNRTIDQIIKVVKVCESTVRKRLLEFDSTPTSQLTIEEFGNVDLEAEQDPPCFTEGKKKAKLIQKEEALSESVVREINKVQDNINQSLKRKPMTVEAAEKDGVADENNLMKLIDKELVKEVAGNDWHDGEWKGLDSLEAPSSASTIVGVENGCSITKSSHLVVSKNANEKQAYKTDADDPYSRYEESTRARTEADNGMLDLTGIDDDEIDQLIMPEEDVKQKEEWFDQEFGDHMLIVKEREEKKRIKEEEAASRRKEQNPKAKKKKKNANFDVEIMRAECMEKLKRDMMEKKFSDKINYSVLSNLDVTKSDETVHSNCIDVTNNESRRLTNSSDTPQSTNRFKKPSVPDSCLETKKRKFLKQEVKEEFNRTEVKKVKLSDMSSSSVEGIEINTEPLPYVEQEAQVDDPADVDDDDDDDFENDEGEQKLLSARNLLSQEGSDDEEEYYY